MACCGHDWERVWKRIGEGNRITAELYRCRHCGGHKVMCDPDQAEAMLALAERFGTAEAPTSR